MKKGLLMMVFMMMFTISGCDLITPPSEDSKEIMIRLNPGIDTIQKGAEYIDPGASAYLEDEEISVSVVINTININEEGSYEIVYEAVHQNEIVRITRLVHVVSQDITLKLNPSVDTVKVNSSWEDAGIEALDTNENELNYSVEGSVDTNTVGVYEITYRVEGEIGNVRTISRYVYVVE